MNTKNRIETDVLVVGAGVAGSTAALTLAQLGHRVVVIERQPQGRSKVGECLPPRGLECLRMLGLEPLFLADKHFSMQGYRVAWDNAGVYERNFLATPYGSGWLLNRQRFDQMLIHAAQQAGCRYFFQTKLHRFKTQATAHDGWRVLCSRHNQPIHLRPKAIVDATGRSRSVVLRLGAKSRRVDGLVACISAVAHHHSPIASLRDVLIESCQHGWWYSAPYSDEFSTLSYFTDGDLPLPKNARELFAWSQENPQLRQRLKGAQIPENAQLIRTSAYSSALDHCIGTRWVAVGDAACSFDPLSSYGIISAMGSGYYGGVALAEELSGKSGHLDAYQSLMQDTFLDFLNTRDNEYQKVCQFDTLFWQRRCDKNKIVNT